jgi:hypothetical protein
MSEVELLAAFAEARRQFGSGYEHGATMRWVLAAIFIFVASTARCESEIDGN